MKKTGKNKLISLMLTLTMALALVPALALTAQAAASTYHLITQSTGAPGEVTWSDLATDGDAIAGLNDGDIIVIDDEPPSGGATLNIAAEDVTVKLGSSLSADLTNSLIINVADGVNSLILESVPVSGITVDFKDTNASTLTVIGHIELTKLTGAGDIDIVGSSGSSLAVEEVDLTGSLQVGVPVEVNKLPANASVQLTASFPASFTATLQAATRLMSLSSNLTGCVWYATLDDPDVSGKPSQTGLANVDIPANTSTTIFLYNPGSPYGTDPGTYYIGVNERDAATATSGGAAMIPWGCLVTDSSGNFHIPGLASDNTLIFVSDNPNPAKSFLIDAEDVKVSSCGTAAGYSGAYSPNHINLLTADTVSALTLDRFTTGAVGGAKLKLQNPVKTTVAVSGDSAFSGIASDGDLDISGSGALKVESDTTAINVKSGSGALSFSNDLTAIRSTQGNAVSASEIVFNGIGTMTSDTRLTIKDGLTSTAYTFAKGSSASSSAVWQSSVTMTGSGSAAVRITDVGPFSGNGGTIWLQVPMSGGIGDEAFAPVNRITAPTSEKGWSDAAKKVGDLKDGSEFTIDIKNNTIIPGGFLEAVAGKDVKLTFDLGGGLSWTVNGKDIPKGVEFAALSLGVKTGAGDIPASVRNIDGSISEVQLRLSHNGAFGFSMTLNVRLDIKNAGYFANLYYYNGETGALEFRSAVKIGADGTTRFEFNHASDYLIVVSEESLIPEPESPWQNPFADVNASDWFCGDVQYAVENDLFSGTSATTFSPNIPMTRGMLVTVLGRMAGIDIAEYAVPSFDDTPTDEYYTSYISWAAQNNIVAGYNEGSFGPYDPISRQDVAVIVARYMRYAEMNLTVTQEYRYFADEDQIADYAKDAIQLMNKLGIINGVGENTINPKGSATRAEVAAMLHRFSELVK